MGKTTDRIAKYQDKRVRTLILLLGKLELGWIVMEVRP